jgi:hypothetical protein
MKDVTVHTMSPMRKTEELQANGFVRRPTTARAREFWAFAITLQDVVLSKPGTTTRMQLSSVDTLQDLFESAANTAADK